MGLGRGDGKYRQFEHRSRQTSTEASYHLRIEQRPETEER